ncbi:MAG: DegT/DnrJ/EryC1/StrS family aminotransferase [Proteobacteria bacterium]|nr:DegT/DnrJ/EryC1/StrS family aminotransferase [Pseudomonadota bacterium]
MTSAPPPAPVPLVDLAAQFARLRPRIEARIAKVLAEGRFILGPEVEELEGALARLTGAGHAVTVASGTDALRLALAAEGIGPGDAVFVPAFTFIATAGTVAALNAEPVFVDVDPETYTLSAADLARRIERVARAGRLKPRAVVPVDLFGLPADYAAIGEVARARGLFVLADAAQSLGGAAGGRRVGTLAPATATSFYPSKPLGGYGDGGALFTDDAARAALWRRLRHHGQEGEAAILLGANSRLDTLQAAVLLAKLEAFADELAARARVAGWYDRALPAGVVRPPRPKGVFSAWALYSVQVEGRDAVLAGLAAEGIGARVYYRTALHLQPAFARFGEGPGSLPATEALGRRILSLPLHADLDEATVARVSAALARALGRARAAGPATPRSAGTSPRRRGSRAR